MFTEFSSDDAVVSDWKSSSLDFTTSSFVDKFADGLSRWVSISDEWLNHLDHVPCGFVKLDENGVVQLSQSEELKDFLWLWGKLSDTSNSDNKSNFWFTFDEEGSSGFSVSLGLDKSGISSLILVVVLFSVGISDLSGSSSLSLSSSSALFECGESFSISSLLLKNVFWDNPGSFCHRIA